MWDLPIRLFHWTLVVLIITEIVTGKIGDNALGWHFRIGYAALALVAFRILWGMIGNQYARFSSFLFAPATIVAYVKTRKDAARKKYLGHNPLGGLWILALLGVVLLQIASGLFANDDIASEGPLAKFIDKDLSDQATWFHAQVFGNLIYVLIGLHLAAIAYYYFVKKENLVKPMFTGDKITDSNAPADNGSISHQ